MPNKKHGTVAIVGAPNAGKSTFLSVVSSAKPKIAAYPFTTLQPKLGVAYIGHEELVIADIPGLIKGASQGVGLGHKFLKHLERCKTLLHLIDINGENLSDIYFSMREELQLYSQELYNKKELIVLTKNDTMSESESQEIALSLSSVINKEVLTCSSLNKNGITEILYRSKQIVDAEAGLVTGA